MWFIQVLRDSGFSPEFIMATINDAKFPTSSAEYTNICVKFVTDDPKELETVSESLVANGSPNPRIVLLNIYFKFVVIFKIRF